MGILGNSTLVTDIEKATSENNTTDKWGLIMDVCDKVIHGAVNSKDCLKTIVKRLNHTDPHVVMQAITLLDACVCNCGKQFHLEVASRDFETEFKRLIQKSQPKVVTHLKLCLKKWAENEFKSDPQLNLIPSLYQKLRSEGHDFSDPSVTPKREAPVSKDPNVVSSQQEEEDIAKAIELSLKESKTGTGTSSQSPKHNSSAVAGASSLYPTALLATVPAAESRKVRALYDFEAAEDNELTFHAGEIIMVLDDSDPNWWKGQNQRGEGLFPSNFVTTDLNVEPEAGSTSSTKAKKNVQFSEEQKKDDEKEATKLDQVVEINEEKIDRLLHLLHEADPEDPSTDTDEMLQLEQYVNQMGPLIDTELERVDRKHAQLTQLSSDLVEAINLYHTLMREPDRSMVMAGPSGYGMPGFTGQAPIPGMFNMPGIYNQGMPGIFPPGMNSMPGSLPPYAVPQLRHDLGQMSLSSVPQFPAPPQTISQSIPATIPQQQMNTSVSAPNAVGTQVLGQQQHVAGQATMHSQMPSQPSNQQSTQPNAMPNMTIPSQIVGPPHQQPPPGMINMSHIQHTMPQNFPNPTSPPPTVNSAPTPLPQQQVGPQPNTAVARQQQPHQLSNVPTTNFTNFATPHQAPHNTANSQQPQSASAPPPNNISHHQTAMAPVQQFPNSQIPHYLQMPPGVAPPLGSGFPPVSTSHHHHMLGMLPPGSPLTINTANSSPQNIPIYQQQR